MWSDPNGATFHWPSICMSTGAASLLTTGQKLYNMKIGVDKQDPDDVGEEDENCEYDYTEPLPGAGVLLYDKYQRQEDKEISNLRYAFYLRY